MNTYLLRHTQVFFYSLGQLARTPFASLMTIAVIGIALALPSGLYLLIDNAQRVSAGWDGSPKISLFLKQNTSHKLAKGLAEKIQRMPAVKSVEYISSEEALAEFRRLSGFGDALDALDYNPLPPVLIVQPAPSSDNPNALERLVNELRRHGDVESAQLDLAWVKRLYRLLQLARRGVWILAVVLGLAVVLIMGNTIRLAVLNRRDEIEIVKLVGGTNAFIRRPFLYTGLVQGIAGALAAWALVSAVLALLGQPIADLARLYGSSFVPQALGARGTFILLGAGGALGWLGSRLAVGRHLREIEPR
jgi:cell division transport system permease protein